MWASTTRYGAIYLGSFLALSFGRVKFCVDRYIYAVVDCIYIAFLVFLVGLKCLGHMMLYDCIMCIHQVQSSLLSKPRHFFKGSVCINWEVILNIWLCSLKGVNSVIVLILLLRATSTIGHLSVQSFWSSLMTNLRTCPIKWFSHLVAPSICGWNAVDIRSFVFMSHCSSCQKIDMNFKSLSEIIESGTP